MRVLHLFRIVGIGVAVACPGPNAPTGVGTAQGAPARSGDVLTFAVQPSNATAGDVITPAIQVAILDSLGTPDSSFTGSVTVAIGSNPVGGNLRGIRSVAATNGVALFGDLSIDRAGSGYTLRASATGMASVTSASFNILSP
ncbi:MAG TPA: hypothetical protein VFU41_14935 [Gemmatimonadales bacterium]|nr:hypothetical protein [Gemmatimonadales bacterium]